MPSRPTLLCLCANLLRRKDRHFVMRHSIPDVLGEPLQFLVAIDGEMVPAWKLHRYPEDARPSGYAVRLTKRIALRKFLQSGRDFLLYLEDDVVISEEFDERVAEAMQLGRDLMFLGGGHHLPPIGTGRWLRCHKTFNNHALLFSRAGAKVCLKILSEWKQGWSDSEIQQATEEGRIEAWCVNPMVAFQRDTITDNFGNGDFVSLAEVARPMLLPDDLAVLDAALNFSRVVVEYGSGGSTLHLGSRLRGWGKLISIEHNQEWHDIVNPEITRLELPVTYVLKPPHPLRPGDGPWRYLPGQLDAYVTAASEHVLEGEADLAFIDGRERIRCALACAKLLRPGGLMMIHDFWGRARYRVQLAELLVHYDYLFDSPSRKGDDPQGLAVFMRKNIL